MADTFTVAYISGAATLVAAELIAVARSKSGDTITEKVKANRGLHSIMVSLLTWALIHFTLDPQDVASNVAVAASGAALGWKASRRR